VENSSKTYLKSAKRTRESNVEEEEQIKADLKQCLQLGDEKVALAIQTYELVNKWNIVIISNRLISIFAN
jgi:hypothetical protein